MRGNSLIVVAGFVLGCASGNSHLPAYIPPPIRMTGEAPFGCYWDDPATYPNVQYINCRYHLRVTCRSNWPDDGPQCRFGVHDREPKDESLVKDTNNSTLPDFPPLDDEGVMR